MLFPRKQPPDPWHSLLGANNRIIPLFSVQETTYRDFFVLHAGKTEFSSNSIIT